MNSHKSEWIALGLLVLIRVWLFDGKLIDMIGKALEWAIIALLFDLVFENFFLKRIKQRVDGGGE